MEIMQLQESLLTNVECYKLFLEQYHMRHSLVQQSSSSSLPYSDSKLDKQISLFFEKLNPTSMGMALEMQNKEIQIKQSHHGQPALWKHLEKGLEETSTFQFLHKLQELFEDVLTEEERCSLLNIAPKTLVEVHLIVDHCSERLTEQQTLQILDLVQQYILPHLNLIQDHIHQIKQTHHFTVYSLAYSSPLL